MTESDYDGDRGGQMKLFQSFWVSVLQNYPFSHLAAQKIVWSSWCCAIMVLHYSGIQVIDILEQKQSFGFNSLE